MIASAKRISPSSEVLLLAGALVVLIATLAMPWLTLEDGSTVTAYRLIADTDRALDVPARITNIFLIIVPVAALVIVGLTLWRLASPGESYAISRLTLLVGLMLVGYYFGTFFYEDHVNARAAALDFTRSGFYVALAAGLGLVLLAALQQVLDRPRPNPGAAEGALELPRNWRWPLAWLRAQLARYARRVAAYFQFGRIPVLAYLLGLLAAIELERRDGDAFARLVGFRRTPSLFGSTELLEPFSELDFSGILAPLFPSPGDVVETPLQQSWEALRQLGSDFVSSLTTQSAREPGFFKVLLQVVQFDLIMFIIPLLVVALLLRKPSNALLLRLPSWAGLSLQIVVLYAALSRWGALSDYRELVLIFMGINIMLAISLNLVNGFMGEFSVGHAGFMAVGAYVASILTMWLFIDERVFGPAVLSVPGWALPIGFLIALVAGGVAAALAGLLVAFPSFRTRGDYLAIVTLAVNFIVTGVINNIEAIGGPRGLSGVPLWTNLPWIFAMTVLSVIGIHHLVSSTFGKGIIAIREDEISAEIMGVNTRRVKLVAFLVSSFIAGVAGGLFAHVLAYVNPGVFGILKSTEALVMVYLGGMGSISGSVIAAVLFTVLLEALRPLAVLKWVVIPLILILLMLYRPQGLFGFREITLNLRGIKEDSRPDTLKEARDDAAAD
jgi:branched-chain amino acid transport system permease protein